LKIFDFTCLSGFAANLVLLPYYTFNYLVSASAEGATSQLADNSLVVLLILIHYRKCISTNESIPTDSIYMSDSNTNVKDAPAFHENPYCRALNNANDIQCKMQLTYKEIVALVCITNSYRNELCCS
jgi:hypothetical protein